MLPTVGSFIHKRGSRGLVAYPCPFLFMFSVFAGLKIISLNRGWKFHHGFQPVSEVQTVDLPHTWNKGDGKSVSWMLNYIVAYFSDSLCISFFCTIFAYRKTNAFV